MEHRVWSIPKISCCYSEKTSFYGDAGKKTRAIVGNWKGSTRVHLHVAWAEIPSENIFDDPVDESGPGILEKKLEGPEVDKEDFTWL